MSATQVFSAAATGRPFIFSPTLSPRATPRVARTLDEFLALAGSSAKLAAVVPASRLDVRPAPEMVSSGVPQLDCLTGGFPRGCLTEICGPDSSGRTSLLLSALAHATARGEVCALVDATDAFDPASSAAAGMQMNRLLWVRCGEKFPPHKNPSRKSSAFEDPAHHSPANLALDNSPPNTPAPKLSRRPARRWESRLAQLLKVTDLLLQSHGFGMIALDLGNVPPSSARRIPLVSWFRFRRVIENTPTALLVLEQQPIAGSCSSLLLQVSTRSFIGTSPAIAKNSPVPAAPSHSQLLDQFEITVELLRSRLQTGVERKPVQSTACFKSCAAWSGLSPELAMGQTAPGNRL